MIPSVSTSQTTSLGALSNGFSVSELSPDALLAYCAGQLSGMDGQIKDFMKLAKSREQARGALNDLKAALSSHKGGLSSEDANAEERPQLVQKYDNAIAAVKATDPELAKRLEKEKDNFCHTATRKDDVPLATDMHGNKVQGGSNQTSDKEMDTFITAVSDVVGDLDQSSQLDMMTLQSIMSKRQTAVQMCTNMVNTLGDTSKTIAANIGK